MSNTQLEIATLVSKYMKDRYGKEMTAEELLQKQPWHKIVWQSFFAYAFYVESDYYLSLEDVLEPCEDMVVKIITKDLLDIMLYRKGKWESQGAATEACWKD